MPVTLKVKRLSPRARLPEYATDGAACFDLRACLVSDMDAAIDTTAHATVCIPTGLSFEVPTGHVMLVFSLSGHGFKDNTRLANCVGVIDSDYRGQVEVKLTRDDGLGIFVRDGARIAQALVLPIPRVDLQEVDELSPGHDAAHGITATTGENKT